MLACKNPVILVAEHSDFYSLNNNNQWSSFPSLRLQFNLEKEQIVDISYNIVNYYSDLTFLCTSLQINQRENTDFRVITGTINYHNNVVRLPVFLKAGDYDIKVIYRTPGDFRNIQKGDYKIAQLQVYFGEQSND